MQYVLGNMLNGGGINPDGLSLDLQFAADKTLTARRGPTPTFIRSSGDNGGTTYFGPLVDFELVDFGEVTAFSTTGISNGRASWFKSYEGIDITISYSGTRWRVVIVDNGDEVIYLAALGSEWRPDQADWSGQEFTIATSSTFGIVKAANNEPRFDHDPVTGVCRGLLIEEGRTNQITFSENLTDTSWSNFSTASAANITSTNPSGGTTTSRLTADSGTSTGRGRAKLLSLPSASYAATVSCFVKAGNSDFGLVAMYFNKVGTGTIRSCNANIVFSTGVITKSGPSNADFTVTSTAFPDGWYRITISATSNASLTVEDQVALLAGLAFNGTGGSGTFAGTETVLAWGAQIEAGSFPTSYIPTTTSTLARSADVCSITGGDFSGIYNTPEGTLFAGVTPQSVAQAAVVVGVNTANYINSHFILKADSLTTSAGLRWVGVSFPPVNIIPSTLDAANAFAKIAYAYKSGSFAMAYNNILAGTSSTTFTSINPTAMRIGARDDGLAINGHISEVKYFKKRLPNAKLQALTA